MNFPEAGCEYEDHRECDIAWANMMTSRALNEFAYSFPRARTDFNCEVGQKVAIVVYSESGVTPDATAMTAIYTQEELKEIYTRGVSLESDPV